MTPTPPLPLPNTETHPNYARVFVGELPLPRDMPTPEKFQLWFDQEMCRLEAEHAAAVKKDEPHIKEEADAPAASGVCKYVAAVENWSSTDGVCCLCFESVAPLGLALRLNGIKCKTTHLAVTLYQCLPEPNASAVPMMSDTGPLSLSHLPLWRNKGYLVFVETSGRRIEEQELRSLFEALGGPLDFLFVFKSEPALPVCGRCSFGNSLIIESVIHRLRNTDAVSLSVAALIDPRRGEVLASLEKGSHSLSQCSMSEQLLMDSVYGFLLRTGRLIGAQPTRIVQLSHSIPLEDILCDTLRSELLATITAEAERYGHLESVVCPTPNTRLGRLGPDAAAAKVFLEYSDTTAARRAQAEINGKTLYGRVVSACFYPLLPFQLKQYHLCNP